MKNKFIFNTKLLNKLNDKHYKSLKEITLYSVSSINDPKSNTLIFIEKLNEELINKLKKIDNSLILLNKRFEPLKLLNNIFISVDRPRKEYARILTFILDNQTEKINKYQFIDGYYKGKNVKIGENVIIEPFVFLDNNVQIGDNCLIKSGAKIRKGTVIGNDCIIKDNAVIGGDGFGIERDDDGTTYKIPHLGGVIIGNHVEIGALASIVQGTIEPTIIEDYVKIDDCAFVAHNCKIGRGTFIIANAEISGSVTIGKTSWIGPNTTIINGISIGNNVTTGIGSVVTKDIKDNEIVAGNPADTIDNLRKMKKIKKKLLASIS